MATIKPRSTTGQRKRAATPKKKLAKAPESVLSSRPLAKTASKRPRQKPVKSSPRAAKATASDEKSPLKRKAQKPASSHARVGLLESKNPAKVKKPQVRLSRSGILGDFAGHSWHDKVIRALVNVFRLDIGFRSTYGNPGSQKKHKIDKYYPDVLIDAGKEKWWIVEVKTTTQVTSSMLPQLEKYLTVAERVWIVVPEPLLEKAKTICRPLRGIGFGTWKPGLIGADVHLQGL